MTSLSWAVMSASRSSCTEAGASTGAAVAKATMPLVTNMAEQAAKTAYSMCFIEEPQGQWRSQASREWPDAKDAHANRQKFGATRYLGARG